MMLACMLRVCPSKWHIHLRLGQSWLSRSEIYGKYIVYATKTRLSHPSYAPYFGMFTIWITDYPKLKYIILAVMGLFVLTGKD